MTARPRPAATVCVLREGEDALEVLMVRRGSGTRFMAGAWVFPGGVVDPWDEADAGPVPDATPSDRAFARAALRELAEEAGIWIVEGAGVSPPGRKLEDEAVYEHLSAAGARFATGRLAFFAHWVTPAMVPLRYDTRFFALEAGTDVQPVIDEAELDAFEWVAPADMVGAAERGERTVALPTRHVLRLLGNYRTPGDFLSYARALDDVEPVQARSRVTEDGSVEVVLPWEPGYDDLDGHEPSSEGLSERARRLLRRGHIASEVAVDESGGDR